jgi:hypothetical protein
MGTAFPSSGHSRSSLHKRTFSGAVGMSPPEVVASFDQLINSGHDMVGNGQAKRRSRLEV